jgi:predicted amidohydrolase YtcJ
MQVDWLLHHGRVYLVDEPFTVAEAIAWRDGRIVAVGSSEELLGRLRPERSWHLAGKSVYPGLIDAHCHLLRYGRSQFEVDLRGCYSQGEMVARVKRFAAHTPAEWLIGRGWDQNAWPGGRFPDRALLDEAFPHRPVLLERIDLHAAVVNGEALRRAGLEGPRHVRGGKVELDAQGHPTGLLIDRAQELVWAQVPEPSTEETDRYLQKAAEDCAAVGLTSVGDALLDHDTLIRIAALQAKGRFPLRVFGMLPADSEHLDRYLPMGPSRDPWLHLGAFKLFADGALGSRGAWLSEPYHDDPGHPGLALLDWAETLAIAQRVHAAGFQLCTHAIGDAANRWVLDLYQAVLPPGQDHRWRIEHAQLVAPQDLLRFGAMGIIPSIQPTHCTSDGPWLHERVGDARLSWAYRQQSLLRQTRRLALGSDFPVEPINPLFGFHAAVSRQRRDGWPPGGFAPVEALTREQALRGMTSWAAWAQREERCKGSLLPGYWADLIVMDQDLMRSPVEALPEGKVLASFLVGNPIFGENQS